MHFEWRADNNDNAAVPVFDFVAPPKVVVHGGRGVANRAPGGDEPLRWWQQQAQVKEALVAAAAVRTPMLET